jgi:hypothetical protein
MNLSLSSEFFSVTGIVNSIPVVSDSVFRATIQALRPPGEFNFAIA